VWNGKPVSGGASAAATVVGPVVAKLGTQLNMVVSGAILTAGVIDFYVDYLDGN
jgi:type III secretory pathway component EscU